MGYGYYHSVNRHPGGAGEGKCFQARSGEHQIHLHARSVSQRQDRPAGNQFIRQVGVPVTQPRGLESCQEFREMPAFYLDGYLHTSCVARGAPRAATACAPHTNHGSACASSTRARAASVSASADMRRAVQQRAYPQVGCQVGAARGVVGPIGPGGARRFVKIDSERYSLRDR